MKNLTAFKQVSPLEPAEVYYATIVATKTNADGECNYILQLEDTSKISAIKAESCFLLPEINDLVLITSDINNSQVFILQVLTRATEGRTIDFGVDSTISVNTLKLQAKAQVSIEAPEINLSGTTCSAVFNNSSLESGQCEIRAKKAMLVIDRLERLFHTVVEKLVNSFRTIEGIEITRADRIRTLVSGRIFYRAKHVSVAAEEEVSIDGKKINLG